MANHLSDTTLRKLRRIGKTFNALAAVSPRLAGKIAFRLFCSPRRLPVRDQDRSFYKKASVEKVPFEGYSLHTYEWVPAQPNGQTVLLVHGWESSAARWRRLAKTLLDAGYRVRAFDAPASGQSGGKMLNLMIFSSALRAVVQAKGQPHAIVGHSLGAGAPVIAMTFLGLEKPQKMVLMAAFAESTRVIRDFGEVMGLNEKVSESINEEIRRMSGTTLEDFSVAQKVALLRDVAGLVIHDHDDDVAPLAEGALIAENWQAQFLPTRGFGHRLQDQSVHDAILRFLES